MRMMFTSPRLENVEAVQALMQQAGIETRITGGRSYKAFSRRGFSYNSKAPYADEPQAQLWVTRADHYRKAREILLEHDLLEAKREPSAFEAIRADAPKPNPGNRLNKIRVALLMAVIAVMAAQAVRLMLHGS